MDAAPIAGFVAPGFEPVRAAFAANFAEGAELGAGFAAIRHGAVIVDLRGGFADRLRERPWARDTLAPVFSTTKPVAALMIARLVDQGLLDYEQLVSAIWPAFAAGKEGVTLAQALSYQAGVPGFADPIDPALWFDPPALAAALAVLAPLWQPGTNAGYHPYTIGYIVNHIAQHAGGRTVGVMLREDIAGPLDVDFHIGLPASEEPRVAEMVRPREAPHLDATSPIVRAAFLSRWSAPDRNAPAWRRLELPSVNGHATALAVAQLFSAFATPGVIEGHRIVSTEAMAAMTRSRWIGQDLVLPYRMEWAAGAMRNNNGLYGPNPDTIAQSGWGGSCGFGDPVTGVSAAYVMNRQSNSLQGDPRAHRIINALYQCLG
jgi:CubicO group peptidase (beta-lactamase class C family)